MTLYEYIQQTCKEHKMSLHELSNKANLSVKTIYAWKNRDRVRRNNLMAISKALDIPIENLIKYINNPIKQPTKREFIKRLNAEIYKRKCQKEKMEEEFLNREEEKRKNWEFSNYLSDLSRDSLKIRRRFSTRDFAEV